MSRAPSPHGATPAMRRPCHSAEERPDLERTLCDLRRHDAGSLGSRVGALHGDHREFRARLDRDAVTRRHLAQPLEVLVARAGVDDHAIPVVVHVVDNQVVDHTTVLAQHAGIERLAGLRQLGDVIGEQAAQVVARPVAAQVDHAHVRDVEHAGIAAHGMVLLDLRAVVDGHVPAAEVDGAGPGRDVGIEKRCAQPHDSVYRPGLAIS